MFKNILLNNGLWAEKGEKSQCFTSHTPNTGGIYAIINKEGFNKGVQIIVSKKEYYFKNCNELEDFLKHLNTSQTEFSRILQKMLINKKFRNLELSY